MITEINWEDMINMIKEIRIDKNKILSMCTQIATAGFQILLKIPKQLAGEVINSLKMN
jgi:hypothetical protein